MCDYQGHEFGANYPDSVCIDGFLWDADSGDACGDGWCYTNGGEIPCPQCNAEAHAEYRNDAACVYCEGTGIDPESFRSQLEMKCPACQEPSNAKFNGGL